MERVQLAENSAEIHHGVAAALHARPLALGLWLGYFFVATPAMAIWAGLLDGPWAAGFAYAVLLLGVGSICRGMLAPRPTERARAEQARAVVDDGHGNHHEVPASPEAAMAWCGYLIVAAAVLGSSLGLADTPAAALLAYALVLLGFAFISLAMLPLRPMERLLRESENRAERNGNRQGVAPRASGMDWTGYFVVAAPVLASWAGLVEGPAATLFAYALLLLGVAFIIIAMRALAKPKMV